MTWETAGIIAEIIAALAVLVSLWYLALQLKQNTDLERAQLEIQLGVTWADMHDNMIQNPDLARAYDLAGDRWDEMSDEDVRAYLWFVAKSFHILEGMFRQRQRGLLSDDVWMPYEQYIVGAFQIESVLGWWHNPPEDSWRPVSTSEMVPDKK